MHQFQINTTKNYGVGGKDLHNDAVIQIPKFGHMIPQSIGVDIIRNTQNLITHIQTLINNQKSSN